MFYAESAADDGGGAAAMNLHCCRVVPRQTDHISNLTAIAEDVAVLKTETRSEMSTMRSKVTDIENALATHVTTSNETQAALLSEISARKTISEQPGYGTLPLKNGKFYINTYCSIDYIIQHVMHVVKDIKVSASMLKVVLNACLLVY